MNWERLSDHEIEEIRGAFCLSRKQFRDLIRYAGFRNPLPLNRTWGREGESALADYIPDRSLFHPESVMGELLLYDMFTFIGRNAKESKLPVFRMINVNVVYMYEFTASKYRVHLHDEYHAWFIEANDDPEDMTIIRFMWEQDGAPEDQRNLNSAKSGFSQTYRKPYNALMRAFGSGILRE